MTQQSWDSEISNINTYQMWMDRLTDYALSVYEWEGLPDTVNQRFLEYTLLNDGQAVFFEDPDMKHMALPVLYGGVVNAYQEPTQWTAYSTGYSRDLTPDNSVIIWNTYSRKSIMPTLKQYAYRLYQVEKTMDVNINSQKFPIVVLVDESQRLTMKNAMQQYDGNEPFIWGNKKGFDPEAVKALQTGAPFVTDKLMAYKHNLWNEAMTFLGVGNAKQDKKERLVADEVAANDEQIETSRHVFLQARQEACEKINKLFNLNVSVDFKLKKDKEREQQKLMKEGESNEED